MSNTLSGPGNAAMAGAWHSTAAEYECQSDLDHPVPLRITLAVTLLHVHCGALRA